MPRELKTHCIHGHEYTPENTLMFKSNGVPLIRRCKTCQYASNKASLERRASQYKSEHGIES